MIPRKGLSPVHSSRLSPNIRSSSPHPTVRHLHARLSSRQPPIPPPTPFVPDPATFLTLIGRKLSAHASKFPDWPSLFSLTSTQLRALGVEPARTRRYLLWWRDRYRKGVFGVGGDLKHVKDGEAEMRVVEVPVVTPGKAPAPAPAPAPALDPRKVAADVTMEEILPRMKRMVVNEPPEALEKIVSAEGLRAVGGMKVKGARQIVGPFVRPVKGTGGSVARFKVQEGMWEVRKGEKIDGGERRKAMVRRKRLLEERRTGRK